MGRLGSQRFSSSFEEVNDQLILSTLIKRSLQRSLQHTHTHTHTQQHTHTRARTKCIFKNLLLHRGQKGKLPPGMSSMSSMSTTERGITVSCPESIMSYNKNMDKLLQLPNEKQEVIFCSTCPLQHHKRLYQRKLRKC